MKTDISFEQLADLIFSSGFGYPLIYVFEKEEAADRFVSTGELDDMVFVHSSIYVPSATLLDKWCKAKVRRVIATKRDELVVLIEQKKEAM